MESFDNINLYVDIIKKYDLFVNYSYGVLIRLIKEIIN